MRFFCWKSYRRWHFAIKKRTVGAVGRSHTHTHTRVRVDTHTCACIHTHTHTHTHILHSAPETLSRMPKPLYFEHILLLNMERSCVAFLQLTVAISRHRPSCVFQTPDILGIHNREPWVTGQRAHSRVLQTTRTLEDAMLDCWLGT